MTDILIEESVNATRLINQALEGYTTAAVRGDKRTAARHLANLHGHVGSLASPRSAFAERINRLGGNTLLLALDEDPWGIDWSMLRALHKAFVALLESSEMWLAVAGSDEIDADENEMRRELEAFASGLPVAGPETTIGQDLGEELSAVDVAIIDEEQAAIGVEAPWVILD